MRGVSVQKIADKMKLSVFNPDVDMKKKMITLSDVNRPALQLSGYFEHFEKNRVQIIGTVEYTYLQHMDEMKKLEVYQEFLNFDIPAVIFCREFQPEEIFLELATKKGIPVLGTTDATSNFMAEMIYILNEELAPCISIHGVLVDVYGEGLLIMGESGIGKSEAASEKVRRRWS